MAIETRDPEPGAAGGTLGSGFGDRDRFMAACARHRIDPERAEALWLDLTGVAAPVTPGRLSRAGLAIVVAGTLLLSAAGIWWATLVTSAAGAPGLLGLAVAWVVVATFAAELLHRRGISVSRRCVLGRSPWRMREWRRAPSCTSWADRRSVPTGGAEPLIELTLLGAGGLALWRYRQPLLTMFAPTLAVGALAVDALVSSFDGWDRDITEWPAWAAVVAVGLAAAFTSVALALDRRAMRPAAMWPSLLADAATAGAFLGIAAAADAEAWGMGLAAALAGALVFARGTLVGRLAQIAIGAGMFWIGVIAVGSQWGSLAIAGLTTVAGVSMIAGAVFVSRRSELIARRRSQAPR